MAAMAASFESTGLSFFEKFKIDFQDDGYGSHLRFPIRMILTFFELQVAPILILPTKVHVNWPFRS